MTCTSAQWWDSYGDECPELKRFAIQVLSLTSTSFGCKRNWSPFEMVIFIIIIILNVEIFDKNLINLNCLFRLIQNKEIVCTRKKMNDLVFVMCNMKLNDNQVKKQVNDFGEVFDHLSSLIL